MEKYNYLEAIKEDIKEYIYEHYTEIEIEEALTNKRDWCDTLQDELWMNDSVTGNASGSYTMNTWKAEENLCHNWDLMIEANNEFIGHEDVIISDGYAYGAEYWDVSIRCYLLNKAIWEVITKLEDEYTE